MKKVNFIAFFILLASSIVSNAQTVNVSLSVQSGAQVFSATQANFGLQSFGGALGYESPSRYFNTTSMVVLPTECKPVLLILADVNFTGDYNPPFNLSDPNISYGYRFLRANTAAAAKPAFAPYIINPSGGYAYQEFSQNVPFSAWNVTNPLSPQRLALGFLENNTTNGLVDGKYWPGSDLVYDNIATNGPREWLFIFDEPYSTALNSTYINNILDPTAPHRVMYMATWNRINQAIFYKKSSGVTQLLITPLITAVSYENDLPLNFSLSQNYPNPFNPTTSISFSIPQAAFVTLKVYDVVGREIANLVNEFRDAGNYKFNFDASQLSSGIYFYQLRAGEFTQTKKLILMK